MHQLLKYIGLLVLGLLAALPVSAQILGVENDPIRAIISPEIPAPGETVKIELQGVGTFLGDATITWQQDGKTVKTGVGERTYSFVAGGLGKFTRVQATIVSSVEGTITRTFNFVPSTVNLIWEANTSVPPLYRGKALYSPGSSVRVSAFPQIVANGKTISYNNLSFQWERNGEVEAAQSGQGRNTFSFAGDQLKTAEEIGVNVYLDNLLVGKGSVTIPASKPQIVLYPRDPLRGVLWGEAFPVAVSLVSKEISVQAMPYFFSNESLPTTDLTYVWKLNGRTTTGPNADDGLMTLRQTGEGTGQAVLNVKLQNTNGARLLQSADATVRMTFGSQTSSGGPSFFGL